LALGTLPAVDLDTDGAPNWLEAQGGHDPLNAADTPVRFVRGDGDGSGNLELADAVQLAGWLVTGAPVTCLEAFDVDDSGAVDAGDFVSLLNHLFGGGSAPAAPFPSAGFDADPSSSLGCN
jgi:hypothetical protein